MTTQFLSRVERTDRNLIGSKDVNAMVGPGSYNQPDSLRKSLPGFAPFTTTSSK